MRVDVPPSPAQAPASHEPTKAAGGGSATRVLDSAKRMLHGTRTPVGSPFALLRRRLILTNLAVAAVVFIALSTGVYAYVAHTDLAQIDQILADQATHQARDELSLLTGQGEPDGEPDRPGYSPGGTDLFAVVLALPQRVAQDDDQVTPYGLPDWTSARPVLSGRQSHVYVTVSRGSYQFRLYTTPVRQNGKVIGAIQTGTSLTRHGQILDNLLRALALLGAGVLVLTGASSVYLTERALAPARESYARQRQFTTAASHELRTPLAVIRSQAELVSGLAQDTQDTLRTSHPDFPQIAAQLDNVAAETAGITAEVDYMTRMVRDLLVLARDASDARGLSWEAVDVGTLARETADKVRPLAAAKQLTLTVETSGASASGEETRVWADADRLRQALLIFLDNAVRYTPAGGTIRVAVHSGGRLHLLGERAHQVAIEISDSGSGIAPEHLPHIFEPFYRATMHHVSDDVESGTGLGLALAQWIAHAHGGDITVSSTPGQGTTFTLTLPTDRK